MPKNNPDSTPAKKKADTSSSARKSTVNHVKDLVPFVANVLKDRTVHDLKKENKELEEKRKEQVTLKVRILKGNRDPVVIDDITISMDDIVLYDDTNASVNEDKKSYLCVELRHLRHIKIEEPNSENTSIEVSIGGVTVYESKWLDIKYAKDHFHHLVKGFIWIDCYREDQEVYNYADTSYETIVVAILFDMEMMPGIMEVLGSRVESYPLEDYLDDVLRDGDCLGIDCDEFDYERVFSENKIW